MQISNENGSFAFHVVDFLDRTQLLTSKVLKQSHAASGHGQANSTIVITDWLTYEISRSQMKMDLFNFISMFSSHYHWQDFYRTILQVTRWVSSKKRNLLNLRDHLAWPRVYWRGSVLLIFLVFCDVFFVFCLYWFCVLCPILTVSLDCLLFLPVRFSLSIFFVAIVASIRC